MDDYISISTLNDFIFCPYSIYLHNVYMESDDSLYHASPQTKGKVAHESIDKKTYSTRKNDLVSFSVYSETLGVVGKIDLFHVDRKMLIERKYQLKQIFRGQLYQLWAQYYCLTEMGYLIDHLAFYEISTNKTIPIEITQEKEFNELVNFIERFKNYNPEDKIITNSNKCIHCIYCNLCDKTQQTNVYT